MPKLHKCEKCGYTTPLAGNMKAHQNRKTPCDVKRSDVYTCIHCSKSYKNKNHMYAHQRICRETKTPLFSKDDVDNIRKEFQTKLDELTQEVRSKPVIQNSNTTTINNITIHAYGSEQIQHISNVFLDRCVKRTDKGLKELIEYIHFNPLIPQNMNLRISNKKLPFVEFHNGNKWQYSRKEEIVNDLVDKGHVMMQSHFEDHEDRLKMEWNETMFEHVREWLERMHEKDPSKIDPILTDIYLLILNNS